MAIEHEYVALSPSDTADTFTTHHRSRRRLNLTCLPIPTLFLSRSCLFFTATCLILLSCFLFISPSRLEKPLPPPVVSDNPYFHTGGIWDHNDEVTSRLERCASLGLLRNTSLSIPSSDRLSPDDEAELIKEGCGTNETTVLILSSFWFAEAYSGTNTAGETIYAESIISTLNAYHYAYLFSSMGWYDPDMTKSVELWHRHRWNVRAVVGDPPQVDECWTRAERGCLKTSLNTDGIEAWRLLTFWYWDDPGNPLGPAFTLSPSPLNDNHFLSYSIEPTCRQLPYLPTNQRVHPPRAYLLSKQVHYLENTPEFSWTLPALTKLKRKLGIDIVGGMVDDDPVTWKSIAKAGITNLGQLSPVDFHVELARSFVFLGVGRPRISPSPWDALCMGVPFVNPILTWDEADPENRTKWHAQQWRMIDLDPPYVYSVFAHDLDGLGRAIQSALDNPIESYIPEYMQFDHVCERMAEVVEMDWRGIAEGILVERRESGVGEIFEL